MEKFRESLEKLKMEVLDMGNLAVNMLSEAIESMKTIDVGKANEVYALKDKLMDYDDQIEIKALNLISLYQPVARDIRSLACILKLITYITRIGRYGKDIAKIVIKELDGKEHIKKIVHIPKMTEDVISMINDAINAFKYSEIEFIRDMAERDDVVDEMRMEIFRECLTYMMENPKNISVCTAYILISRYLERCGDHAAKMCEKIHYMVTGERIEIK